MNWLLVALVAMFSQQTVIALGKVLPAIVAPAVFDDLGVDPALLGVFVSIVAAAALVTQVGCGSFIVRYGPLRMSQLALLLMSASLAIATPGLLILFALSAFLSGGFAVSTPASSHLLGRYAPKRIAPLIFSIKQTAVPTGILLGGLVVPWLLGLTDWRGTLWIVAGASLLCTVALQPLRREFDSDRIPTRVFQISDFRGTITTVLSDPGLRNLAIACFAFNGVQATFTTYFVVYLTELGYDLAAAGAVFSFAMAVAIPGRIVWGWLSGSYVTPRRMMAVLSLVMAASAIAMGFYEAEWPVFWVGLVATFVSMTAVSWQGVLLAETVNLAPQGSAGGITGGVLCFGQFGGLSMPLFYSLLLSLTDSYSIGFAASAIPAIVIGIALLRPAPALPGKAEGG